MKTTLQHFKETLTDEELEKAILNADEGRLNYKFETPSDALSWAFYWSCSPQGHEYWSKIDYRLLNNEK